jgi:hypothetical protein
MFRKLKHSYMQFEIGLGSMRVTQRSKMLRLNSKGLEQLVSKARTQERPDRRLHLRIHAAGMVRA